MIFKPPQSAVVRLSVTKTWSWHKESPRTIDTKSSLWKKMRQEVLQRDNYTCRFCGVRSAKFMVCDHIDGNPSHNDPVNLDIYLKTLQLFSETLKVPLFSDVDSSAVIIADRTIAYANVLLKLSENFDYTSKCDCSSTPHDFSMHKGFFKADSSTLLKRILENRF
ncbi:hypothetical protein EDD21DRAFT_449152 [Dissophora ornata]|nr:hypothetical protein EDD21DRAFT_449152 [Dissophora ornata]